MTFRTWSFIPLMAAVALATVCGPAPDVRAQEPQTKVFINGTPAPVFFNDGDSFRVLAGEYKGTKARLAGYNTLESYGAVHSWGDWTAKEMYVIAKMATLHARKGVWNCETDGKTDTYGRMLLWCPDLATELVRLGYAHAMSIDDEPGKPELLAAQRDAIANKRGLWAHGVPAFILTSLHSVDERVGSKNTYNRLVSSDDAHSVKWHHTSRYRECERVCHQIYSTDTSATEDVLAALRDDRSAAPELQSWIKSATEASLRAVIFEFAEFRHIGRAVPPPLRAPLREHLHTRYVQPGKFGRQQRKTGACMVHVDFKRRYGAGRAACLK